ncbi:MAG: RHS repeat-associated core domain-containing protein, partial [Stenotrophomonas maltophilia]
LVAARKVAGSGAVSVRYQHTDALGSPVAETNEQAAVVLRTAYTPYGASIGASQDGVGYTGHVMDGSTGLTYMQQRYMDPTVGVFLSVDPVTAHEQPLGQFHRYRYANNSPYKYMDPNGREAEDEKLSAQKIADMKTVDVIAQAEKPQSLSNQASVVTLGTVFVRATPAAMTISSGVAATVAAPFLLFAAPHPCGGRRCGELTAESRRHAPGIWPGDTGADEWGKRNGVGKSEGRRRFHRIKQADKGQGGGKGQDNYGTNPSTGDVVNPQGETVGNLGD